MDPVTALSVCVGFVMFFVLVLATYIRTLEKDINRIERKVDYLEGVRCDVHVTLGNNDPFASKQQKTKQVN